MNVGDTVIAAYKSGRYVGELIQLSRPKAKVRVLAVLKHPAQGDLHHPMQADVAMFHVRRALSFREVANVFVSELEPYSGPEVPAYEASLQASLEAEMAAMKQLQSPFGERSLQALQELWNDYFGA